MKFKESVRLRNKLFQKTLISLGFTEKDYQVYTFLAINGPKKANDVAEALTIHRWELYRILKKLQNKGIIHASDEIPAYFSVEEFEKVLDALIATKKEQYKALQESMEEILYNWNSIIKKK